MNDSSRRYPDPAVRSLDPRFDRLRLPAASVEHLHGGCRWSEGPVWFGDHRCLLWSDIPNNRILRWDEDTGAVSVFRQPSNFTNGNTRDREGRLISCEHLTRRVVRTEYDGRITTLADSFEGRRLNSPNDVVVASDGSVWFTDPPFGIENFYEGQMQAAEQPARIYRIDPHDGAITVASDEVNGPNGLAFSLDGRRLYVVAARAQPRELLAFDVSPDGRTLARSRVLAGAGAGTPDGLRVDIYGNLWCGWGMGQAGLDGVRILSPDGDAIGHIDLPERCANLCFGGLHCNRLFMAASHGLYSLYVNTQGAPGG